jgi:NADH:ubiquinone oxidoreductase subunit 6 (subunit J)
MVKEAMQGNDQKGIFLISGLAALIGGLCCMTPIILVLLGLASISSAAGLGNVLYGEYRWEFRIAALAFLALALGIYFRRRGICTLDEARRQRQRIINTSLLVLVFAVGIYVFWTYIAVHYWGIAVGLPWAQYDESWAVPVSATLLGLAIVLYVILFRGSRKTQAKETQNGLSRASKISP